MRKLILSIGVIFVLCIPALLYTQNMSDYCSAPPYATRTVPPNILVIIDNSRNMLNPAYSNEYDSSRSENYIGYFKTDKTYCASEKKFYEASSCSKSDKGPYPGSLLNWAAMSKYDISMHVLIGGKEISEPSDRTKLLSGENMDWDSRTTSAYSGCVFDMTGDGGLRITSTGSCSLPLITSRKGTPIKVKVSDYVPYVSLRGIIQKLIDRNPADGKWDDDAPRIGVMRFEASRNDIRMAYCPGNTGKVSSLISAITSAEARPDRNNPNAPLGTAMIRAIQYYKHSCGTPCSPCADPIDSVQCRRNFVIAIGSGEATDIPSSYAPDEIYERIRQSHTTDIRSDRDGAQMITYYNISVFDDSAGVEILKGFSKYGGFVDQNANKHPDWKIEWDNNSDGNPDTYYEVKNVSDISAALEKAFLEILAQAASGTAVSVLSTSSRRVGSAVQAYFLPITVDGSRQIYWTGYMQNLWIDPDDSLREDSVHDYKLILDQDKVMKFYSNRQSNETEAALFTTDADGSGGSLSACSNPEIKPLAEIKAVWEAGKKLALKAPSERIIFTSKKIISGNTVIKTFRETPFPEFKRNMNGVLKEALNPDGTYTSENIVGYVRGECMETGVSGDGNCRNRINTRFRDRRLMVEGSLRVWKLGDIISSSPKIFSGLPLNNYHIDYADRSYYDYISNSTYKEKSSVVFVGANDGMLHAFRSGYLKDTGLTGNIKAILKNFFGSDDDKNDSLGEEIWAYIPYNAFPYLKYLADPNYCHVYYNDLPVRLVDASINGGPTASKEGRSWRTILIGGMRLGGACGPGGTPAAPPAGSPEDAGFSSYFALDVTDPEKPVPLWEFSDADLGYTTSSPAVIRTGDRNHNGSWYVVFGSGSKILPKGSIDIGRSTTGFVYVLNLDSGELVKKIKLAHNAIVGDILAIDADKDYVSEKIYFGTAYKDKDGKTWKGELLGIDIQKLLNTSDVYVSWGHSSGKVLFSGQYPFTSSPDAARDMKGNVWVFSGTGKYYSDIDETDISQQLFFGLKDKGSTVKENDLDDATDVLTIGEVTGTGKICTYDSERQSFGLKTVVTSVKPGAHLPADADPGWKIYLKNGERAISRPVAVGAVVDFLTYKPDADQCKYSGDSYLYSVSYTSGVACPHLAIRSPAATSGVSGTVTIYNRIHLGAGAAPAGDALTILLQKEETDQLRKKIQTATGGIAEAENQPLFSTASKIMHWLKK